MATRDRKAQKPPLLKATMKYGLLAFLMGIAVVAATVLGRPPGVHAAGTSVANDRAGDLVVFSQDYGETGKVPGNICLAMDSMAGTTSGLTLGYDGTGHCVSLGAAAGASGKMFVGGLSPSLSTTITLDMGIARTQQNATVNVYAGGAWLAIRLLDGSPTDDLEIKSNYYTYTNPTLHSATSVTQDVGFDNSGRFRITVVSNTVSRENVIYLNDVKKLTTPYTRFRAVRLTTVYDPFVNPFVYFDFSSISSGQTAKLKLYSLEQSVPEYRYVTPISDPGMVSFGVDGPHAWSKVNDGLSLLDGGTIWADVSALSSYSSSDMAALKALIADGFELGIHFSSRLTDLSLSSAYSLMDRETAQITAMFGQSPQSWCSLQGADNSTHAVYAYTHHGMVSRNGVNGSAAGLASVGNLGDNCWTFWSAASAAGISIPSFSHQLDVNPAITWSISADHFSTFVSNYASHGMRMTGFREYWQTAQNSYHTTISDVVSDPGVSLSFTVENMGGQTRLLVDTPWANAVRDGSGHSVPYEVSGSGIVIEVGDGSYVVSAGFRADFTADKRAVEAGQAVQFTNLSSGGAAPLSYEWDFGDGAGSTLKDPSHAYSNPGTYAVALHITDSAGHEDTMTRAGYIEVTPPDSPPDQPANISPAGGAVDVSLTATLGSSDFADPDPGDTHAASRWQVRSSAGTYDSPAYDSGSTSSLTSIKVPSGKLNGSVTYFWRVAHKDNHGLWSDYSEETSFTTSSSVVPRPDLVSPANGATTSDRTPYLDWSKVTASSTVHYQLQVDNNADFSSPAVSKTWVSYSYYTVTTSLSNGTYYWRVRAVDASGNTSSWTAAWSFTVGTVAPAVPVLVSPADGAATTDHTPYLDWGKVTASSTVHYQVQVDNNADFSSPTVSKTWVSYSYYTVTTSLSHTTYYWRVRAVDASGNKSAWSSPWSFKVA